MIPSNLMSLGTHQSSLSFNKEGLNDSLAIMNKNQRGGDFTLLKVVEEKQIIVLFRSQSLRLVQSQLTGSETTGTPTGKGTSEPDPQQPTPNHQL